MPSRTQRRELFLYGEVRARLAGTEVPFWVEPVPEVPEPDWNPTLDELLEAMVGLTAITDLPPHDIELDEFGMPVDPDPDPDD